ncbi:MAG TPA: hypothetical protein VFA90_16905 [Terriglobales bacterium]|nr:hypothetical protein [Terriglobales bacterium]
MQAEKPGWPTEWSGISGKLPGALAQPSSGIILTMQVRQKSAFFFFVLLSLAVIVDAQASIPTVSFRIDFPGANPSHYEIVVPKEGTGSYSSNGKINDQSDAADPAAIDFSVSDATRKEIFELAKRAKYFTGKVDSGRQNIANTGEKTLAYKDANHNSQATYNFSNVAAVQQLTSMFQGLSAALECGRRLTFFHRYQKLALDDELKKMEELNRENMLGDLQAIAPILKSIADDSSVMNVSRARALRLLSASESTH